MQTNEIISLGTKLGLPFDLKTQFDSNLIKNFVVFDGANGERYSISGEWTDDEILEAFGNHLIEYGKKLKCMEIKQVLSVN